MTTDPSPPRPARRGALPLRPGVAVAALVAFALAGCSLAAKRQEIVGSIPDDYRANHPIRIEERLATIDIPVSRNAAELTAPVKANIAGFAQRFNESGSTPLAIVAPVGSPNEAVAANASRQIRDVLVAAGVKPAALDFRTYPAGPNESGAPIRLAYNRIAAQVKGCGQWPDRLERNFHNRNFQNFGCATQSNLAAMVENPLDLLYPRAMTPPDAVRRSAVVGDYRGGRTYSSQQGLQGGTIAGVGN